MTSQRQLASLKDLVQACDIMTKYWAGGIFGFQEAPFAILQWLGGEKSAISVVYDCISFQQPPSQLQWGYMQFQLNRGEGVWMSKLR